MTYLGCLIRSGFDGDIKQQNGDDGTWMVLDEAVRGGGTCAMDDWVGALTRNFEGDIKRQYWVCKQQSIVDMFI